MIGELNPLEIEDVLRSQLIGRLGCHAFGRTYVVPITYAYDRDVVYAHSTEGMKLHMMRENPHICFEVDFMDDLANWRSVIAWGTFTEIREPQQRAAALDILVERVAPHLHQTPPGASMHPHYGMTTGTLYRIDLDTKTGRYERRL